MSDADWEPLPADALVNHPGEFAAPKAKPVLSPSPPPVATPSAPPSAPPGAPPSSIAAPDPAAERALHELQRQLAASAPARSWIASAQHRDRRRQRKAAAAGARVEPLAATMQQGAAPDDFEYDEGAAGRDPREEEPWFLALPAEERERLHDTWARQRARGVDDAEHQRRVRHRRFVHAQVCFLAVLMLGTCPLWHATVGAAIVCGIWWRHSSPDRFGDPGRAVLCFGICHGVAMAVSRSIEPTLWTDAVLLVALAAIVGFEGEIRRSGGFDAR